MASEFHREVYGKITMKIVGTDKQFTFIFNNNNQPFDYGKSYSTTIATEIEPDQIHNVEFTWKHPLDIFHQKMFVDHLEFVPLSAAR